MTFAWYLEKYAIDRHIARIFTLYRNRRDVAMDSIERYFPGNIRFTRPEGGLFTWVELPEGIPAREILNKCLEKKIAFVPGGSFFPNSNRENTFRINFSNMPEDKIETGLRIIGKVIRQYMNASKECFDQASQCHQPLFNAGRPSLSVT